MPGIGVGGGDQLLVGPATVIECDGGIGPVKLDCKVTEFLHMDVHQEFSSSKQQISISPQSLAETGVSLLGIMNVLTAFAMSCSISPSLKMSFSVNGDSFDASGITLKRACHWSVGSVMICHVFLAIVLIFEAFVVVFTFLDMSHARGC